jgi:hypothetical protein
MRVERFNRTLLDEWAYARPYRSETERRQALPQWLHTDNHHRGHTALDGPPPASRVPNLRGQYSGICQGITVCCQGDSRCLEHACQTPPLP